MNPLHIISAWIETDNGPVELTDEETASLEKCILEFRPDGYFTLRRIDDTSTGEL